MHVSSSCTGASRTMLRVCHRYVQFPESVRNCGRSVSFNDQPQWERQHVQEFRFRESRQIHLTRDLFSRYLTLWHTSHCGSWCRSMCLTKITHAHVITCLSVCCSLTLSSSFLSRASTFSLSLPVLCPAHPHPCGRDRRGIKTTALTHNEEYCPVAIHNPLIASTHVSGGRTGGIVGMLGPLC